MYEYLKIRFWPLAFWVNALWLRFGTVKLLLALSIGLLSGSPGDKLSQLQFSQFKPGYLLPRLLCNVLHCCSVPKSTSMYWQLHVETVIILTTRWDPGDFPWIRLLYCHKVSQMKFNRNKRCRLDNSGTYAQSPLSNQVQWPRTTKWATLTKDNTTSNNTSNSSKPGATQFSIGSFELVY